jgi:flagellar protein FliS
MTYAQAAATYQRNAILNASPEKLVKLLYDGAILNLEKCRAGLEDPKKRHSAEVGLCLSRAMGILGELRASLVPQPDSNVAGNLDRLYDFALDQISQANLKRTPQGIHNTLRVMRTLKEGWDAVIPG